MNYTIRQPLRVLAGDDSTGYRYWVGPDLDHWSFDVAHAYRFAGGPSAIRKQMELDDFHAREATPRPIEIVQFHRPR